LPVISGKLSKEQVYSQKRLQSEELGQKSLVVARRGFAAAM